MDAESGGEANLTMEGGIIGTPAYMAPERFRGGKPDGRSDVYSLGIMLYQMLTGRMPFIAHDNADLLAVAMLHLNREPAPLRGSTRRCRRPWRMSCCAALRKEPQERPSAAALARTFRQAVRRHESVRPRIRRLPVRAGPRRRRHDDHRGARPGHPGPQAGRPSAGRARPPARPRTPSWPPTGSRPPPSSGGPAAPATRSAPRTRTGKACGQAPKTRPRGPAAASARDDIHLADTGVAVIGAGVVGLAVAARLAPGNPEIVVLERHPRHGQETSSRNSEVIHGGMYYPTGSLKARLCVDGNPRLYGFCADHDVPHRRIGKVIVAVEQEEMPALGRLLALGTANGVEMREISAAECHALEPNVRSVGALLSPNTGIVNAHALMDALLHQARDAGALLQPRSEVVGWSASRTVTAWPSAPATTWSPSRPNGW